MPCLSTPAMLLCAPLFITVLAIAVGPADMKGLQNAASTEQTAGAAMEFHNQAVSLEGALSTFKLARVGAEQRGEEPRWTEPAAMMPISPRRLATRRAGGGG